jgi:hypothetical protein
MSVVHDFAVLCGCFAPFAVKPSAETAKLAKKDAKLRKAISLPWSSHEYPSLDIGYNPLREFG